MFWLLGKRMTSKTFSALCKEISSTLGRQLNEKDAKVVMQWYLKQIDEQSMWDKLEGV